MITVLTIKQEQRRKKEKRKFFRRLRDKIQCERKIFGGVTVEHFTYTHYGEKINWKRIKNAIGSASHDILCAENIDLPYNMGFSRFNSDLLLKRLAENTVMSALINAKINPARIKITLYDKMGQYSDFAQLLAEFTTQLKVITSDLDFYMIETDRIMQESGMSVMVYDDIRKSFPCDIFISPEQIDTYLPSTVNDIIITSGKPCVPIKGTVIYDFKFDLPEYYKALKPDSIADEYFACALYSKGNVYNMGSMVPHALISTGGITNGDILSQSILEHLT